MRTFRIQLPLYSVASSSVTANIRPPGVVTWALFVGGVFPARVNTGVSSLLRLFDGVQQGFHASCKVTCGESVINLCWYSGLSSGVGPDEIHAIQSVAPLMADMGLSCNASGFV